METGAGIMFMQMMGVPEPRKCIGYLTGFKFASLLRWDQAESFASPVVGGSASASLAVGALGLPFSTSRGCPTNGDTARVTRSSSDGSRVARNEQLSLDGNTSTRAHACASSPLVSTSVSAGALPITCAAPEDELSLLF